MAVVAAAAVVVAVVVVVAAVAVAVVVGRKHMHRDSFTAVVRDDKRRSFWPDLEMCGPQRITVAGELPSLNSTPGKQPKDVPK